MPAERQNRSGNDARRVRGDLPDGSLLWGASPTKGLSGNPTQRSKSMVASVCVSGRFWQLCTANERPFARWGSSAWVCPGREPHLAIKPIAVCRPLPDARSRTSPHLASQRALPPGNYARRTNVDLPDGSPRRGPALEKRTIWQIDVDSARVVARMFAMLPPRRCQCTLTDFWYVATLAHCSERRSCQNPGRPTRGVDFQRVLASARSGSVCWQCG